MVTEGDDNKERVVEAELVNEPLEEVSGEMSSLPDISTSEEVIPASKGSTSRRGELVRYDPLRSYLNELRNIPKLSADEEKQLAIRYKEEDDSLAGYKLVMANLRLVVFIAKEYRRNLKNILDLIQEGNVGLLEAVEKYDPYRGVRFPSYASYWIRAYMLRYLINNVRLVKVGTTQAQRKLFFNLQKEKQRLESEGFVPEAELLAKRLKVKESEVIEMEQRLGLPDLSVDAPIGGDEGGQDFHSILGNSDISTEEVVARQDLGNKIAELVEEFKLKLGDKEKAIIERRLFTSEPETLQEIASVYGMSRERIRQIESALKKEMKNLFLEKLQIEGIEDLFPTTESE